MGTAAGFDSGGGAFFCMGLFGAGLLPVFLKLLFFSFLYYKSNFRIFVIICIKVIKNIY